LSQLISNGAHVHGLLQAHCKRMVTLQGPVLHDSDNEPLHQLRVTMRKLRATLAQFGPCLVLPAEVNDRRLAKTVQRLGVARDLDVLRERLESVFLPQLPQQEQQRLKPVRRQLARERRLAGEQLESVLKSSRHLELIAQLQSWLKQPRYSALGDAPLLHWIPEWAVPGSTSLMLHPAWWLELAGQDNASLHNLRKDMRSLRYRLENIEAFLDPAAQRWIASLKQGQSLLGELNDLDVLQRAIHEQSRDGLEETLPQLAWLLEQNRLHCWRRWRQLAEELHALPGRRQRLAELAREKRRVSGTPFHLDSRFNSDSRFGTSSLFRGLPRAWRRALIDFVGRLR
jgi:CHAD domain-containing protein